MHEKTRAAIHAVRDDMARTAPANVDYAKLRDWRGDLARVLRDTSIIPVAGDTFEKLRADMDARTRFSAEAREWVERLDALIRAEMLNEAPNAPEVEIVRGSRVHDLPSGSIVIACRTDGTPESTVSPRRSDDREFYGNQYRVLYRAPEPPLTVGSELPDDKALRRAPRGTIVRGKHNGIVAQKTGDVGSNIWETTGSAASSYTLTDRNEYVVIYVPEGSAK